MYPETGQRRIVEVLLTYHQSRQTLESRRNSLQREADRLLTQAGVQGGENALSQLVRLVRQTCSYQEGSGSTAYDALLEGTADSQGMALALALLCQRTQPVLSCTVVDGQWNGVSHLWNVVQTAGGYRHVDLTQPGEPVFSAPTRRWPRRATPGTASGCRCARRKRRRNNHKNRSS